MSSDLRSLIIYGLDNEARREFWPLVMKELCPPEFDDGVPPGVLADWYEERGDQSVSDMLRAV